MFKRFLTVTVIFIGFSSTITHAGSFESLDHLTELAKSYISSIATVEEGETLEVNLSQTANHLQLAQCDQPIQVSLPNGATASKISTLEMTCHGTTAWQAYVPVDVKVMTKVLVAKETIASKETLTQDMIDYASYDKNTLFSGYFTNPKDIEGLQTNKTIASGTVLTKKNVQSPILINRNQNVSIINRHGAILIRAEGIAKSSGALNEVIKVLNTSSKRTIDAVVVSGSSVEVQG